jgi:Tol biopolymer transport system component
MGEVYRAKDTRLGRSVAVKVLLSSVASDPDRRKRFEREARAVAALSHPHICAVFDVGREETSTGPVDYLVMELLDGDTLAERLRRGPMPTDQLLKTGIEIASALDNAHRAGIVHRDVKPGNVILTKTGAKLLDFGLARLRPTVASPDGAGTAVTEEPPTRDDPLTDAGKAVGTYPYMAPEQLEGKSVDARADLFALGAVLYEMATGRRAFTGTSQASLTAAILTSDPSPIRSLRPVAPMALERLVRTLLVKNPDDRVQTAHDVVLRLRDIAEESTSGSASVVASIRGRNRRALRTVGLVGALVLAAAAWRWVRWAPPPTPPHVVPLTEMRGVERFPTFSPDGEQVAFDWQGEKQDNWDIYIKMVDAPEVRRLTTDKAPDVAPRWSPDGKLIAYLRYRPDMPLAGPGPATIHVISPLGGSDRKVSDFPALGCFGGCGGPVWSPDGRWLAVNRFTAANDASPPGVYLVSLQTGEARPLMTPAPEEFDAEVAFSPDGRRLAGFSCTSFLSCHLEVVDLGPGFIPRGSPRRLAHRPICVFNGPPAWTRDGRSLIYSDCNGDTLWRIGVDGGRPPERIELAGVGAIQPATVPSRDRLAFQRSLVGQDVYRLDGGRVPRLVVASSRHDEALDLSPDGKRVAFVRYGEIWSADADLTNAARLTERLGGAPRWSPDGRRVAFDAPDDEGHLHVWTVDADGGSARRLTADAGDQNRPSWSRDGRSIYFSASVGGGERGGLWRMPATGGPAEHLTRGDDWDPVESFDGMTLIFRKGAWNAPLVARPLGGGTERVLVDCVHVFAVARDGVYYLGCRDEDGGRPLYRLDPASGQSESLGTFEGAGGVLTVSPDGRTILYTKQTGEGSDLTMIDNFR